MGETGFVRFPTSLDPTAQEFRPINQMTSIQPQIYFPYQPPEFQIAPFCDFPSGGAVHPTYATPPAHAPPLPPPSAAETRTLLLSSVPTEVSESEVRRDLELFGDVRAVETGRVRDGIVTVHFYDVRHASAALAEIRRQHMQQQFRLRMHFDAFWSRNSVYRLDNLVAAPPLPLPLPMPAAAAGLISGHAVWAQFTVPREFCGVPDWLNQGTVVVFNLDSELSAARLTEIFEAFGPVKEVRETPLKRHQRFIEFYDVRNASKALSQMNGKEINGKHILIEFSRPGGGLIKKFSKSTQNVIKTTPNFPGKNPRCLPPPPPRKIASGAANLPPQQATQLNAKVTGGCNGKKNSKKCQNINSGGGKNQQLQLEISKVNRGLVKGRRGRDCLDTRFLIKEDGIAESSNCRDPRTTVMIKNIPNKYSQKLLLNMLDNHCIHCNEQIAADGGGSSSDDQPLSSYDFVYLPIDFINKCNVGYGFVNMTSPQATWRLYKAFHLQNWEVFNSKKICEVTYARLQGVEALKEHFKNSKFPYCDTEEYLPVVFSPPRDGQHLTEPTPIVVRSDGSPPTVSSNSSEEAANDDREIQVNGNNECHSGSGGGGGGDDKDDVGGGRSSCNGGGTPNGGDNNGDDD